MTAANRDDALRHRDQVDEHDPIFRDAFVEQDPYGRERGTTRGQHRIEQQDVTPGDIFREGRIVKVRKLGHLVPLDQYLADPNRATYGAQFRLHALAGARNGDSAELRCEAQAVVLPANWRLDLPRLEGQQIEAAL